ncbi:MAG: hypothetical protein PHI02_07085 [Sulfurovaceae bacterium]|nr:hypothetical protein [Sulfurovaceae bacterium]
MKTKELYIKYTQQARAEHVKWVNNIKLLISGVNLDEKVIALNPVESSFGKWYYEKAILLSFSNSQMVLFDIEKLFLSIHDVYIKIYPIYYEKNKSIIGSIFGKRANVSAHETILAEQYYEEIVLISDKLKNKINLLEKILHATSDERFEEFVSFENEDAYKNMLTESEDDGKYHYGARCRS